MSKKDTRKTHQLAWSLRKNFTQENKLRIAKEAKTQKAFIYESEKNA